MGVQRVKLTDYPSQLDELPGIRSLERGITASQCKIVFKILLESN